jgi:hypothetical protein
LILVLSGFTVFMPTPTRLPALDPSKFLELHDSHRRFPATHYLYVSPNPAIHLKPRSKSRSPQPPRHYNHLTRISPQPRAGPHPSKQNNGSHIRRLRPAAPPLDAAPAGGRPLPPPPPCHAAQRPPRQAAPRRLGLGRQRNGQRRRRLFVVPVLLQHHRLPLPARPLPQPPHHPHRGENKPSNRRQTRRTCFSELFSECVPCRP